MKKLIKAQLRTDVEMPSLNPVDNDVHPKIDENYIWWGTGWHNFTSFSGTKFANAKEFRQAHLESDKDHNSEIEETKTHSSATSLSIWASD